MSWHCHLHTDTVFCKPETRFFKKCPSRIYYKSSYICSHRAIYTYQSVICCSERPSKRSRNEAFDRDPKPCEICALNSKYSRSYVNLKKWSQSADIDHFRGFNPWRLDPGPGIRPFLSLVFMVCVAVTRIGSF